MKKTRKLSLAVFAASFISMLTSFAPAHALTFSFGTSGTGLSATADFSVSGNNLVVVLTNQGGDVIDPPGVLTSVFFDLVGVGTLTPVSAVLTSGSTVVFAASQPVGGVVGGEWAYLSGLSSAPVGATEGISSSGLGGLFGNPNFPGSNLQDPAALDGLQYGLTSCADNTSNGNAAVTGGNELIQCSVTFTLSGLPSNFVLSNTNLINIAFQYGTALDEPCRVPGGNTCGDGPGPGPGQSVPEPSTFMLLGSGLLVMARRLRSKKV